MDVGACASLDTGAKRGVDWRLGFNDAPGAVVKNVSFVWGGRILVQGINSYEDC